MPAGDPHPTTPVEPQRAGPLRSTRHTRVELPEYLPARMLNEFVYCPRLFFYEWVEQLFTESADTVAGSLRHEKLERKSDALPPPEEAGTERIHSRSVTLASDAQKLIATIDLIEGMGSHVTPADYKKGRPRDGDDGPEAWDADKIQVGDRCRQDTEFVESQGIEFFQLAGDPRG